MKKILHLIAILLFSSYLFCDTYQIKDVKYNIKGKTRQYALEQSVLIDKKTIFKSEDELIDYISDFKKQLENTRNFETIEINFNLEEIKNEDANNIEAKNTEFENADTYINEKHYYVNLEVSTVDSSHFLAMPYPKYDSNSGFVLKIKLKDTNFFGSMKEMSSDINLEIESKDESDPEYKFGFNIDFNIPFKLGAFNSSFNNNFSISYTIGDSTPEWNLENGISLSLPFNKFSLDIDFTHACIRDLDYENKDINGTIEHYGDGTYFVENATLSVPITLHEIHNWGKVYYTPSTFFKYIWDFDGINEKNTDLQSPKTGIGQSISTSRINWEENFRTGISFSISQDFTFNLYTYEFSPSISGEIKAYKAFKHFGLNTDIYAFGVLNDIKSFGSRLRGIRDEQYYSSDMNNGETPPNSSKKACESPGAIMISIDMPIKLFRIYWDKLPGFKKIGFMRYFNMEVQFSPFVDFALCHNRATDTYFDWRDGFYSGGIEVLVFPLKWKSFVIRGSLGIDLGQKMPVLKTKLNQEWRDSKWYELSIGLGLMY